MGDPLNVILVGAGGYGARYLEILLSESSRSNVRLAAVIDPNLGKCSFLGELCKRKIPVFGNIEEYFSSNRCDLTILATPIHFHCSQTCLALSNGSHVLCEKPLCANLEQARMMQAAENSSGKTVTIGYQWSFNSSIQRLKADILSGRFGRPLRFRSIAAWPRGDFYYNRNRWVGRKQTESGEDIFDSPVNNATAHFLHNMLYLLGKSVAESAVVDEVEAELWRANPIENYDTAALRIHVSGGAQLLFYTSHATKIARGVRFSYEFERATVEYEGEGEGRIDGAHLVAREAGGHTIDYGSPYTEPFSKLWNAVESARTGKRPICGIAAAAEHTRCMTLAQQSPRGIGTFSSSYMKTDVSNNYPRRYIEGLGEMMDQCYSEGILFSELKGKTPFVEKLPSVT